MHLTGNVTEEQGSESGPALPTAAELVASLRATNRAVQTLLIAQARASGLGLVEFLTLVRAAEGNGITPLAAGRSLGLRSSTMTGLVDRLEQDKLIRRHPHPSDRRLLLLKATPRGRKVINRTIDPLLAELLETAGILQPQQRALLQSFMEQITDLALAYAARARPRPTRRATARQAIPQPPRAAG